MSIEPRKKLRQTLLCFPTLPTYETVSAAVEPQKLSQAAIELPMEVWSSILTSLSTISLKGFRLVCKEWSKLGASWLFGTVYLDSYEDSWVRFQNLANSRYASLTIRIMWTPLYISETCLDSAVWQQKYPHLTQGISHTKSLQLHKIYRQVYHENREKLLLEPTARVNAEALKRTMAYFLNCHTIRLEDDVDVETSCQDPFLRRRIQCDADLLQNPSIWGRTPCWWSHDRPLGHANGLSASAFVLDLIESSSRLYRLELYLWNLNLFHVLEHFDWHCKGSSQGAVTDVYVRTKYCRVLQAWLLEDPYSSRRVNAEAPIESILKRFPDICKMTVQSYFIDPGPMFLNIYHRQLRENEALHTGDAIDDGDDGHSTGSSSSSHYSTLSALESKYQDPTRPDKDSLLTLRTELHLNVWSQVPNLRSLNLQNVTINTRSLISWLCNQAQVPQTAITIRLTGITMLYGLDQSLFGSILQWLNVNLIYDHTQTYYHETKLFRTEQFLYHPRWTIKSLAFRNKVWYCSMDDGTQGGVEWTIDSPSTEEISKLHIHHHSSSKSPPTAQFLHRPGAIRTLVPTWGDNSEQETSFFVYYACPDSNLSFKWVHTGCYLHFTLPTQHALLIVEAKLDRMDCCQYESWSVDREIALAEQDEPSPRNQAEFETDERFQADLAVYEAIYLRQYAPQASETGRNDDGGDEDNKEMVASTE